MFAGPVAEHPLWPSPGSAGEPGGAGETPWSGRAPVFPQPVTEATGLAEPTLSWGGARPPRPGPRPSGRPGPESVFLALRRCSRPPTGRGSPRAPAAGEHGVCGAD